MKKIISILMCIVLACCVFAGCAKKEDYKSDIVLITNGGTISDGGYNQSAWDGISSFAGDNNMSCRYYQPQLDDKGELTTANVEQYVKLAQENGAKFIVLPGEDFAVPVFDIASSYPDISFILIDAIAHSDDNIDSFPANVMSIKFNVLQSGFLAGYLAVATGNTELGFFGELKSDESASYGAGFVEGAGYAADELGVPVVLNWADYDAPFLDYNYDMTITACYDKVEDCDEPTFAVKVENGIGTGVYTEGSNVTITANPAPVGQVFDHWDVKSDTEGVKDSKVNISSSSKDSMNLLVEKCDCTLTAVYKDVEGEYNTVTVMNADGTEPYAQYTVTGDGVSVVAPVATNGMVFDKWETTADLGDTDPTYKEIWVPVDGNDITLTPTYKLSETPTFNVTVVTGEGAEGESTGSGSYLTGDVVELAAAIPQDGYMFSHWSSVDSYGKNPGVSMDNEFYWNTKFEMNDRYASICKDMFNDGVTLIFDGGNSLGSAYEAKRDYDFGLSVLSAGANNKDSYSTIVKDFGEAVKDALENFQGGTVVQADCSTNGLYASYVADDSTDEGKAIIEKYDAIYAALADGSLSLDAIGSVQAGAGFDFCKLYNQNPPYHNLTLNDWFIDVEIIQLSPEDMPVADEMINE